MRIRNLEQILNAARRMDWMQVALNHGPACFYLQDNDTFCTRAQRWDGHDDIHPFVSLEELLNFAAIVPSKRTK